MAHLFICPNCGHRSSADRAHGRLPQPCRRAAPSAASASCSSCSTTTTRRPNAAFFVCDQQGRVIGCGRGSRELTGLSDEKVIGRPVQDVLGLDFAGGRGPRRHGAGVGRAPAGQAGRRQRGGRSAREGCRRPVSRRTMTTAACCSCSRPRSRPCPSARPCPTAAATLFILLVVLGLIAASRRDRGHQADRLGLDLQGGVQLVYEGRRPSSSRGQRRRRSTARSTSCATASTRSASPSPSCSARARTRSRSTSRASSNAERAERQVGTTAQMYFYDWEPNILDADCKTNPEQVNGGQQAITGLYNAVKRASKCKPAGRRQRHHRRRPLLRLRQEVQPAAQRRHAGGEPRGSRGAAQRGRQGRGQAEILKVPEGIIVVRDEDTRDRTSSAARLDNWWVLQGQPGARGTDIKNPEQNFENGSGGAPIVTMELHRQGPQGVRQDHARDRPARRRQRGHQRRAPEPGQRLAPLRDPARQRADLDAVHQLPREPGRHRRRDGRADLRRLHDPDARRISRGCSRSARCRCGWS